MNGLDGADTATILVVDDTADNLILMSSLLKDQYKVKIVNSGEKALTIAASDTPPDLILLDIMMPDMDGYEVCRRLKGNPGTRDIPVIFLTAKAAVEDERKGLELGAVDYITKPISPPIVLARVKNHLALKAMADFQLNRNMILEREVAKRTSEVLASREIAIKNLQLEEAGRMKSEFLASMSHELRTPLNAIIGFSEVLKDGLLGELAPKQKEYINDIFTSGSHLLSLINDILDLSKVEAGKMTLELEPLQVAPLIQAGLQVVRERAMTHSLHLVEDVADGLADVGEVWLDERKVKQILYNLLSNAVKFTPAGGTIHIGARRVDGSVVPNSRFAHYLELTVRDSGIGISDENQRLLFQPFTQIDSTLARRYEGTGLGLVMVKRLAELHGGAVVLHSVPEKGSTFTVWLPWRTQGDGTDEAPDAASAGGGNQMLQKPVDRAELAEALAAAGLAPQTGAPQHTVLIVDDDPQAVEILDAYLEHSGYRVLTALGWQEGMNLARSQHPNLIVVDLMMPEVNGFEVVEALKRDVSTASIPVVIVTAKQLTAEDHARLNGSVLTVIQKSKLYHDRFIGEVMRAVDGKET